ncbi:glycerophosphodiester phosphodiesterase, partial [bacterium]|nr:glycerophosphodiester phosphodiesterase [bacterium]
MRNIQRILTLILLIAGANLFPAFSRNAEFYPFFEPYTPARTLQVMAHRATTSAAPENTLPAFEYAVENGFEWIEIDVRLCKDSVHVIWHNSILDDKSNSTGAIKDMRWDKLSNVDAGAWFAPRFAGTKLLSLNDALKWAKGKINLYLDCKDVDPALLVKDILDADMENQVAIYDGPEMLERINKASNGRIPLMAKCGSVEQLDELMNQIHVAVIEVNPDRLTKGLVDAAHQRGVYVQVKSLGNDDNEDLWRRAIGLGVDYVQTDRAEYVQATVFQSSIQQPHCWVSAHRGASRLAPENTRASIQAAVDLHCEFAEIDVRQTADGKFALLHDSNL